MARFTLQKPGLLLGEGKDEVMFFGALLTEMHLMDRVQVLDYGGVAKLREFLDDLAQLPGFEKLRVIAITRDADEDAASAQSSLRNVIDASQIGDVLDVCSFVLPDNINPGALESLWLASLKESPLESCVDAFFDCAKAKGWKPSHTFAKNDKARIQLHIATKDTPNERFGLAAWHGRKNTEMPWMKDQWVDFEHPAFAGLKKFLADAFAET